MANVKHTFHDFQQIVTKTRIQRSLSQKDLADALGVSQRTVQNWEAGKVPQFRHRRAILEWASDDPVPA